MLSDKINSALNKHLNAEMYSSYLYLSMSAWFESKGLSGFANWMRIQAQEETSHGEKFFDYINERGGLVILEAIDKPKSAWLSPLTVFEEVLTHEEFVSSLINDLVDLAIEEKDHASNNFLQWFVAEQVEEEASAGAVLDRMKLIQEDSAGLFAFDLEMSKRTFNEDGE